MRDAAVLGALMQDLRPDLVVHASAATPDGPREATGNAAEIVAINIAGAANVIETVAACGVGRVIAMSSVAVYGRALDDCAVLTEDLPPRPQTLYAIIKASAETLALRLGALHGIPVLAPRGVDIRLLFAATAPLCDIDLACDMLLALISAPWQGGVVNMGADRPVDLLAIAQAVGAHYGVGATFDAAQPNVPFFAVNCPPMALDRMAALTGRAFPTGPFDAPLQHYAGWLDALDAPDTPCPRH